MSSASGGSWIMARRSDGRSAERLVKRPTKTGPKKNTKQQQQPEIGAQDLGGSFLFFWKGRMQHQQSSFFEWPFSGNQMFLKSFCFDIFRVGSVATCSGLTLQVSPLQRMDWAKRSSRALRALWSDVHKTRHALSVTWSPREKMIEKGWLEKEIYTV